jgi:hypothetical protein
MDKSIISNGMDVKEKNVRLKSSIDDLIDEDIEYKKLEIEIPLRVYLILYQKGIFERNFLIMLAKSVCDADFLKEVITLENKKEIEKMQRLLGEL